MHVTVPFLRSRRARLAVAAAGLALALAASAEPAAAQAAAATQYRRTLAREEALRKTAAPSVSSLRALATAYEAIPRRYPRSGYSDNALWQAAGVLEFAYERGGQRRDKDQAIKLLRWLRDEYPSSSLRRQAIARLVVLTTAPVQNAARTPPPAPAAPKAPTAAATSAPAPDAAAATPVRLLGPVSPPSPPVTDRAVVVEGVTHSVLPRGDRVTIELSRETTFTSERLTDPDRVVISLAEAGMTAEIAEQAAALHGTYVRPLGMGRHASGDARLALELLGNPRFSIFPLYAPFRLVVDIETEHAPTPQAPTPSATGPTPFPAVAVAAPPAVAAPASGDAKPSLAPPPTPPVALVDVPVVEPPVAPSPAPPASTARGDYSLARQLGLGVSRIVIDPGHGGRDPGAKANGVNEADLVLDIALRLEKLLLAQPGVEVVLTRRDDSYVSLEERTAIANREGADLFLSIHANSSSRTATRGVETFFLNFASNPQAEAVAARENASSAKTMSLLPQLLQDIALNNKLDESRELAAQIQTSLVRRLRSESPDFKDLGVKQAPFLVLIGAGMPSVLSEIAFLTNRTEAAQLKRPAYRQRIAQALADGLVGYQASLKKVSAVATADTTR